MPRMPETLEELRDKIKYESDFVGVKPFSHNLIGICLSRIAKEFGQEEANKAIRDFGLDNLGWNVVEKVSGTD